LTKEEMSPEKVWHFYDGRANVENMIKEGITSHSLDVNISHFHGAIARFLSVMLAYGIDMYSESKVLLT
jgi:phosphopantetheinyl transferase